MKIYGPYNSKEEAQKDKKLFKEGKQRPSKPKLDMSKYKD